MLDLAQPTLERLELCGKALEEPRLVALKAAPQVGATISEGVIGQDPPLTAAAAGRAAAAARAPGAAGGYQ